MAASPILTFLPRAVPNDSQAPSIASTAARMLSSIAFFFASSIFSFANVVSWRRCLFSVVLVVFGVFWLVACLVLSLFFVILFLSCTIAVK